MQNKMTQNKTAAAGSAQKALAAIAQNRIVAAVLPYLGLILTVIVFYFTTGGKIFNAYNQRILIQQTIALSLICIGGVFTYTLGGLDVSLGASLGLCTLIEATVINATGSLLLGFVLAILLAVSFGVFNGYASIKLHLPTIVTSLFLMFIGNGVQTLITLQTDTIKANYNFALFKDKNFQIAVLAGVFLVALYLYRFTRIGKNLRAMGANKKCAAQAGVSLVKYQLIAYVIIGVCIAISSLFVLGRTGSSSRVTGAGYHMDVMVALILGGMPLSGGMKSRLSAAIIGPFTYTLLSNGLTLSGVLVSQVPIIKALIFFAIVVLTCRKKGLVLPR